MNKALPMQRPVAELLLNFIRNADKKLAIFTLIPVNGLVETASTRASVITHTHAIA